MHWKGGRYPPPPPRSGYAQPLSPSRQVPASMAFVTDSNRPQPLGQPPLTAYPTAPGAASEVPSLLMLPWGWAVGGGGSETQKSKSLCTKNSPNEYFLL